MPFTLSKNDRNIIRSAILVAEADNYPQLIGVDGFKFKRICERNESVYRCVELGVVIKRFNFIYTPTTPLRVRIPTINIDDDGWVVQPIAIKKDTKKACSLIRKQLGNFKCDLHWLNVGWWNGKPVMFDW